MTRSKSNGKLRRRGGNKPNDNAKNKTGSEVEGRNDKDASSVTPTTAPSSCWKDKIPDIKPLLLITAVVVLPYTLHNCYLYVFLQRPELLAWLNPNIRPPVTVRDARQLLVVGTMSSGTTQLAHELASKLNLEIGHENSETSWSFVRDGTVSWFHGIRFLPRPGIDDLGVSIEIPIPREYQQSGGDNNDKGDDSPQTSITVQGDVLFRYVVDQLCRQLHPNMGFHPFMFRHNRKCSLRKSWSDCWKDECKSLLTEEWGCALSSSSPHSSCTTPYHKTLHQVRHPLRTIESLVTKFCIGGVEGDVQPSFVLFARALFPKHDFSRLSCIEAAGYYVYEYNTAMLQAAKQGAIDHRFSVEDTTPCSVSKLAGFLENDDHSEYFQNKTRERLLELCHSNDEDDEATETISNGKRNGQAKEKESTAPNQPMVSSKNTYNKGLLSLDWDDLLGGKHGSQKKHGNRDLQQRLKKLTHKELQYDN